MRLKGSKRGWYLPNGEWYEQVGAKMDISTREHGVVEWHCKHGVGHPIGHVTEWKEWMGMHGCCGCAPPAEFNTGEEPIPSDQAVGHEA